MEANNGPIFCNFKFSGFLRVLLVGNYKSSRGKEEGKIRKTERKVEEMLSANYLMTIDYVDTF